MSYDLDLVTMLLSSDWFLPEWQVLGIFEPEIEKPCVQKGCREIVLDFMAGADQYWQISFNPERLRDTHSKLYALLKRCRLSEASVEAITRLISSDTPPIDQGTRWLLVMMTERLLEKSDTQGPSLDAFTKRVLADELNKFGGVDFKKLCSASMSQWDSYLRELTPDQTSMLADYAASLLSERKFRALWGFVNAKLTATQKRTLLEWYRSTARSLTGEPLRLDHEV